MNHDFVHLQSHRLAARVTRKTETSRRDQIHLDATLNRNQQRRTAVLAKFRPPQQEAFTSEPKKEQTSLSLAEILGKPLSIWMRSKRKRIPDLDE